MRRLPSLPVSWESQSSVAVSILNIFAARFGCHRRTIHSISKQAACFSAILLIVTGVAEAARPFAPQIRIRAIMLPSGQVRLLPMPRPAGGPFGFNQISASVFDAAHNAIRIEASPGAGGMHSPSDADQVFTSVFDEANNAIHVVCIFGCGAGGAVFQVNGTNTASQTPINLANGANIAFINTSLGNIQANLTGVIPAALLPAPTAGSLGGIQAVSAVAHQWINSISVSGAPTLTQPAFSDVSGVAGLGQLPASLAQFSGGATAGDCAKWSASGVLADAGAACASGGVPGGANAQVQFNNAGVFGGAPDVTYNTSSSLVTAPNFNNVLWVDGIKYTTVAAAIAALPLQGGAVNAFEATPETFTANPFVSSQRVDLTLGAGVWYTSTQIQLNTTDQLDGLGRTTTEVRVSQQFPQGTPPPSYSSSPLSAVGGGSLTGSYYVVVSYVNPNGETTPSAEYSITLAAQNLQIAAPAALATGAANAPCPNGASPCGWKIYAATATGAEVLQGGVNAFGSPVTLSAMTAGTATYSNVNTTGAVFVLGSGGASFDVRVQHLTINCSYDNTPQHAVPYCLGVYNPYAQEESGIRDINVANALGGLYAAQGPQAQNSQVENVSMTGQEAAYTQCLTFAGVPLGRAAASNVSCAPNHSATGVAGVLLIHSGPDYGIGASIRDVHCEGFADCVELTKGSAAAIDTITGSPWITDAVVHLDASTIDTTVRNVVAPAGFSVLKDDVFSYSDISTHLGFYSLGDVANSASNQSTRITTASGALNQFNGGVSGAAFTATGGATYAANAVTPLYGAGSFTLGGGAGSSASALGALTIAGQSTSGAGAGGDLVLQPGVATGVPPAGVQGVLVLEQSFVTASSSAVSAVGDLACAASSERGAVDCPPGAVNWLGVALSNAAGQIGAVFHGEARAANFDSGLITAGDVACAPPASTGVAGKLHDNGQSACAAGQSVGIVVGNVNNTAHTADVLIR